MKIGEKDGRIHSRNGVSHSVVRFDSSGLLILMCLRLLYTHSSPRFQRLGCLTKSHLNDCTTKATYNMYS